MQAINLPTFSKPAPAHRAPVLNLYPTRHEVQAAELAKLSQWRREETRRAIERMLGKINTLARDMRRHFGILA